MIHNIEHEKTLLALLVSVVCKVSYNKEGTL